MTPFFSSVIITFSIVYFLVFCFGKVCNIASIIPWVPEVFLACGGNFHLVFYWVLRLIHLTKIDIIYWTVTS